MSTTALISSNVENIQWHLYVLIEVPWYVLAHGLGTTNIYSSKLENFKFVHISYLGRMMNSDFIRTHNLIHLFIYPFTLP